jgi:hypothetical protein
VVPEHLHVSALGLDCVNLLVATVDQVGVAELVSGVTEVLNPGFKILDFRVDLIKFDEGLLTTAFILVEVALLELLSEKFHLFLELADLVVVLLGLRANQRSNFFLDVLSELLEIGPVVEELLGLLDLRFLGGSLTGQVVQGLLKLVEVEHGGFTLLVDLVNRVDNRDELLDVGEILVLGVGSLAGFFHP